MASITDNHGQAHNSSHHVLTLLCVLNIIRLQCEAAGGVCLQACTVVHYS
jgi:hypothetical protein